MHVSPLFPFTRCITKYGAFMNHMKVFLLQNVQCIRPANQSLLGFEVHTADLTIPPAKQSLRAFFLMPKLSVGIRKKARSDDNNIASPLCWEGKSTEHVSETWPSDLPCASKSTATPRQEGNLTSSLPTCSRQGYSRPPGEYLGSHKPATVAESVSENSADWLRRPGSIVAAEVAAAGGGRNSGDLGGDSRA